MQKLKLNVDDLRVDAFEPVVADVDAEGTALAYATLICSEKRSCGGVCPI